MYYLHYTRGITPKHVASGGAHLGDFTRLGNTALKKHRSSVEPLVTLRQI